MSPSLIELDLASFTERLAARTPTPGGGSVAAHLVGVGCALVTMAARFTSGPKYSAVEAAMAGRVEELERLRADATPLVDRDRAAYDAVTAAAKLPKSTEAEIAARTATMQAALRGALDVPARTLSLALAALRVVRVAAPDVNPNLASDAATGVWCLRTAAEAAMLNVKINASSIADKAWSAERLAASERELAEVRDLAETARVVLEKKLA